MATPQTYRLESGLELFKPTIAAVNGVCLGYAVTAVSFCDFVIASIHSRHNETCEEMTERICKALANPLVTVLGHIDRKSVV